MVNIVCSYKLLVRSFASAVKRPKLRQMGSELLAECAAAYTARSLTVADIQRNEFGQPYSIDSPSQRLFLSLSHSGNYLVAMASCYPCGVDIERHKARPYAELWQEIRHPLEPNSPASLAEFYQWWTRKEAAWKVFACQEPSHMQDLQVVGEPRHFYKELTIIDLSAPQGYALSIALQQEDKQEHE